MGGTPAAQQRDQRHHAALAVVVRVHRQQDVGDGDDDHHRPEDQRHDPEDVVAADRDRVRVLGVEHRLKGVDRAGADVTEDDTECPDDYCEFGGVVGVRRVLRGSADVRVGRCATGRARRVRRTRLLGICHGIGRYPASGCTSVRVEARAAAPTYRVTAEEVRQMTPAMTPERVLRTYITLVVVSTAASSMIWGINTLFLLDAGLSIGKTFAANAFFTVGMVLFEVPTGVVADTVGRRTSYLLGTATLFGSTLLYLLLWRAHAPFVLWAVVSVLLGLGFTFFSGATEAWLVDGLHATGVTGQLEQVFGRAQTVGGAAMLIGTVSGGVIAQATNLGVPYVIRAAMLLLTV